MCNDVTEPADKPVGQFLLLCADFPLHLLAKFGFAKEADIEGLSCSSTFEVADEWIPAFHLFSSFSESARTLVIEFDYFDLDYRSEVAVRQESTFSALQWATDRLHFFSAMPDKDSDQRLYTFAKMCAGRTSIDSPSNSGYLGYAVIPRNSRRVGRSLVTPRAAIRNDRNEIVFPSSKVAEQTRTAAAETVNLFGNYLVAVGIPFMEQDGNVVRCAHVSAWMCHYTAVLRGAVARRPIAQLNTSSASPLEFGRRYPSLGLTVHEMTAILKASDMPPDILTYGVLRQSRQPSWSDRRDMRVEMESHEEVFNRSPSSVDDEELLRRDRLAADVAWTKENLSAAICRYLNSGMPVVLLRRREDHTQVVVGYLRESDLVGTKLASAQPSDREPTSDVMYFLISDDKDGPFYVVSLADLVDEIVRRHTDVLVPLPHSLWLSGSDAEILGTRVLEQMVARRLDRLSQVDSPWLSDDAQAREVALTRLQDFAKGMLNASYTVRTYAATGVDLKESFEKRVDNAELAESLNVIQLPRYVWVIEAIHRGSRKAQNPKSVHATVVLDATELPSVNLNSRRALRTEPPLFAHLPGQILAPTLVSTALALETRDPDFGWKFCDAPPYPTGRWNHEMLYTQSPLRTGNQVRGAVAQ